MEKKEKNNIRFGGIQVSCVYKKMNRVLKKIYSKNISKGAHGNIGVKIKTTPIFPDEIKNRNIGVYDINLLIHKYIFNF
jgi:hypothetical protein